MKKRILSLVLALCLVAGLLPMATLAAAPTSVKVQLNNNTATTSTPIYLEVSAEAPTKYASVANKAFVEWTETAAPADNYVKAEYAADSEGKVTVTVTLKNVDVEGAAAEITATNHIIILPTGEYASKVVLEGTNTIVGDKEGLIYLSASQGSTIVGEKDSTLSLTSANGTVVGLIASREGDLLIKDATLTMKQGGTSGNWRHSIQTMNGNVAIEGCKITSTTGGGAIVHFGRVGDEDLEYGYYYYSSDSTKKMTLKDSDITATSYGSAALFSVTCAPVVDNCTIVATMTNAKKIFRYAPEFTNCYAVAGLKATSTKAYDAKKNDQYTYMKVTPGQAPADGSTDTGAGEPDCPANQCCAV